MVAAAYCSLMTRAPSADLRAEGFKGDPMNDLLKEDVVEGSLFIAD